MQWLLRFFRGPALNIVLDLALGRLRNEISDRDLSEKEKILINELLDFLVAEINKEISGK